MLYIFKSSMASVIGVAAPGIDSKEFALVKQMVSYITSFAIHGDPNSFENDYRWEPTDSDNPLKCFNITNDSSEMIEFPRIDSLRVWDEICEDANVTLY